MKEKIKKAAAHLFAIKGYTSTSMREIARDVGVTKAALYYHYESKDELFFDIIRDTFTELIHIHQKLAESDLPVWDIMDEWVEKMLSYSKVKNDHWQILNKFASGNIKNRIYEEFARFWKESYRSIIRILERGIDHGEIRKDIDTRVLAGAVFGIVHGQFSVSFREKITFEDDIMKSMILGILKGGIATHEVQ
jgi:TetR/AcrR family transcriptional regulator, cholesterol catabolism regulator